MATHDPLQSRTEVDEDLEQYMEEEQPGWLEEFVSEQARRSPWWTISFLVHLIALLVMWRWPGNALGRVEIERAVALDTVDELVPDDDPETVDPDEPEEPPFDYKEVDVPIVDKLPDSLTPTDEPEGVVIPEPEDDGMKGDIEDLIPSIEPPSPTPILAVATDVGPAPGDYFRRRTGRGRKGAIDKGETTRATESCVDAALRFLAIAQEKSDGRWDSRKWGGGDFDVAATGLALLAFQGAGHTHLKGRFRPVVAKGLAWLARHQKPNGQFPYRTFYEQGIAAMAVCEAYGMTRSPRLRPMAQRAIDHIVAVQPEHGGYRYRGPCPKGEGDMSVTGWQIMAVKSALYAGLRVPPETIERFRVFLKNSYRGYGKSAYTVGGGPGGPTIWAIGVGARQLLGGDYDEEIRAGADALLQHGRKVAAENAKGRDRLVGDLYFTYYSVFAMFQMEGEWKAEWNRMFRDPLVKAQVHEAHDARGRYIRGSWDPANHRWGDSGGRIYSTAMAVLSLEVYYRMLPVYRSHKKN